MKKIGIVVPYYGKFPNYFALFLRSCENNPTIDWIVFTDIMEVVEYPKNVLRVQMTFQELKKWLLRCSAFWTSLWIIPHLFLSIVVIFILCTGIAVCRKKLFSRTIDHWLDRWDKLNRPINI